MTPVKVQSGGVIDRQSVPEQLESSRALRSTTSRFEQIVNLVFHHPTAVTVMMVAEGVLSCVAIAACPFVGGVTAVILGIGGAIFLTASVVVIVAGTIFFRNTFGFHHDMRQHTFTPTSQGTARLFYQGDVPILELASDDPYRVGHDQGCMMGPYLKKILSRLNFAKYFVKFFLETKRFPHILRAIKEKIPSEYLEEMKGIADGFNTWQERESSSKKIEVTIDTLLMLHLMADQCHFDQNGAEKMASVACTVVVDRDEKEGLTFGRNMDWPSFGIFGDMSCVIHRKYSDGRRSTAEVGFPGLVGTFTGMNDRGVSLAMNVCAGHTISVRGMPAVFFNRSCLEHADSALHIKKRAKEETPLGPYHLTVVDATSAQSIHFWQGGEESPCVVRKKPKHEPLITTNCRYTFLGQRYAHMHHSEEREKRIRDLFRREVSRPSKGDLVRESLTLPYVNNMITTHKVVMCPQSKRMQVAFDNAYCGEVPLHEVDTAVLFGA